MADILAGGIIIHSASGIPLQIGWPGSELLKDIHPSFLCGALVTVALRQECTDGTVVRISHKFVICSFITKGQSAGCKLKNLEPPPAIVTQADKLFSLLFTFSNQ